MPEEYFCSVQSNSILIDFHFFDRNEKGKLYINLRLDYGSQTQSLECKTLGNWVYVSDFLRFKESIKAKENQSYLIDVNKYEMIKLLSENGRVTIFHESKDSKMDKFNLLVTTDECIIERIHDELSKIPESMWSDSFDS